MNKIVLSFLALLCCINIQAGVKLQKQGSATQLVVNDKPMLLLAGELSNSAATSPADIRKALKQMKNSGVNSVFVPAYWEFVEPNEGKYDFALVDSVITTARKHDLKIVFLWFGAWKNSMSCYAPLWVKENIKRFPRSLTENGKPLEICTAFSDNLLQADKRAFCELMKHIKAVDSQGEYRYHDAGRKRNRHARICTRPFSSCRKKLTDNPFLPHYSKHSSSRRKVHGQKFSEQTVMLTRNSKHIIMPSM